MRSILVTGAGGLLGFELCLQARRGGWDVCAVIRERPAPEGVRMRRQDVRDARAVAGLVASAAPDVVVHTAYRLTGPEMRETNVDGAAIVAAAAREAGARLVHISSDVVFSGAVGRPLREDDPPDPLSDYGRSKAEAERAVAAAHPDALIARTSLLYAGPRLGSHEVLALEAARGERDVTFFTDELRSPIAVGDLAGALLELATLDLSGPLHVAGADGVDRLEFARLIAVAHGLDPQLLRGGEGGPDRPKDCRLDSSRAVALLQTRLRGAREVLAGESRNREGPA
jgi:dTDP-4-dehydrorhamnose reductase